VGSAVRGALAFPVAVLLALPVAAASAQATDPAAVGQILLQRSVMESHAERSRARLRGRPSPPAVSAECLRAWKLHDRMTRAQRRRLYELCPR